MRMSRVTWQGTLVNADMLFSPCVVVGKADFLAPFLQRICLTFRDSQVTENIHVDGEPLLKPLWVYLLSI